MTFTIENFRQVSYNGKVLNFDKNFSFHTYFGHKRKTKKFPFHKTLLEFMDANPNLEIYFTLDDSIKGFEKIEGGLLVNTDSYVSFCRALQSNTKGRARAFLGQHLDAKNILTDKEKAEVITESIGEDKIIDLVKNLDLDTQKRIIEALGIVDSKAQNQSDVSKEEFLAAFSKFLTDETVQSLFIQTLPQVQIELLKKNKKFIENSLDKNEEFFQNWIDEKDGKYRKQRCLMFGIDLVDPKREGEFIRKRFDILAEQNRQHHVLIEMKSPTADIFTVKEHQTKNEGKTTEYTLSEEISRAIPQVLGYRKWYESARLEEIQALGIEKKKKISRCIIVIGTNKEDDVWLENFEEFRNSINIEIWTYTDLIDKLENTIKNLQENL